MKKDYSQVPQTCPLIADILSTAKNIYSGDEPITKGELQYIETIMEKIRTANSELREWGNEQYNRAEELENDLGNSESKITELTDEINYLKKEIEEIAENQQP